MSKEKQPAFGLFWFGDPNKSTVDYSHSDDYFLKEAYAHACPSRLQVKEAFGAEWALERYATCDEVMEKLILERASELNPALLQSLISPTPRLIDEPVGKYEEGAVPENYATVLSLGSMSYGYSIPRVIIEVLGRDAEGRLAINDEKLPSLLDGIEQAISESQTPYELLAKLAALALDLGASEDHLLSHIFAQGIIGEQNCVRQYLQIEVALKQFAPALWARYDQMKDEEKQAIDMWIKA